MEDDFGLDDGIFDGGSDDDNEGDDSYRGLQPTDHGMSRDAERTIFRGKHPTASQWKELNTSESAVSVTIGEANHVLWKQAQAEVEHVRHSVSSALGGNNVSPSMSDLFNLIFGPRSEIGHLLEDKLEISSEELGKMLGTFFLASAFSSSKTQVFNKKSMLNIEGLASGKEYQEFWDKISSCGVETTQISKELGDLARARGSMPLWMDMQTAINRTCAKLFIKDFRTEIRTILDDDKMYFNTSKKDTQGLKRTQHVKDNRKGFVTT